MNRWIRVAAAAAVLALTPATALAQDATEQAKTMFNVGAAAYESGKYPAAIQAFTEAYRLSPRPGILFSIAQAYRRQFTADKQAANLRAAIKHYREYIAKVEQGGRRAEAVQALSELEPMAERLGSSGDAAPATPAAPERRAPTQLMVSAQTKEATITLDGGKPLEAPLIAEVKAGKHRIHLEAPGFFPEEREVQAAEGGVVALDIAMRERPGLLTVVSRDGADVSIDGRLVATTPLARAIEVPPGRHFVAVTRRGYKAFTDEIDLGRGEERRVDAHIELTKQRIGAYVLMGVGAATALGGGGVAALAIHEQQEAQTLDQKRMAKGGLTSDELEQYKSHQRRRDELRGAAAVAFGGAIVLGGTAVLMAIFDQPTIEKAHRDSAPSSGSPSPTPAKDRPMEMSAVPLIGPGFYGMSLSGSF
ncbi:TonB-dependent receptor [Minicystis rosea]|nr:TonB-dependent receptor [Minicystis rosea]